MSTPRPFHVILDFDGTITARDTIDALVQNALALKHPSWSSAALAQSPDARDWTECQDTYVAELGAHRAAAAAKHALRRPSLAGDLVDLGELWGVEEASVRRVGEKGIFRGVTGGMLRERGGEVTVEGGADEGEGVERRVVVRKGFREFVGEVERRAGPAWGVVSVNWSREWIRGVLGAVLGAGQVDAVPVMANEINDATGMIEGCRLDLVSSRLSLISPHDV